MRICSWLMLKNEIVNVICRYYNQYCQSLIGSWKANGSRCAHYCGGGWLLSPLQSKLLDGVMSIYFRVLRAPRISNRLLPPVLAGLSKYVALLGNASNMPPLNGINS